MSILKKNLNLWQIRDGLDENAPLLQKYCSTQSPVPITTTNPYAHIRFHSDASLSDQGFLITYAAVSGKLNQSEI